MTTSYVQEGDVIDHIALSAISSGDIVRVGNLVCVALADIANGDTGSVKCSGVFDLPKIAGVIAVGASIDYDVSLTSFTTGLSAATGDVTACGVCVEAALSGDATVRVRLSPGAGTVN